MTATVYFSDANELVTVVISFTVNGALTDGTVVFTVTDPAGVTSTPSVTHVSLGKYSVTVALTVTGVWAFEAVGTAASFDMPVQVATVTANDPLLSRLYCTPAELKSRIGQTGTIDDSEILLACQGASREIDNICGRYFWRGTATRTYVPDQPRKQKIDDIVSVTSLKVDQDGDGVYEDTWTSGTDYRLTPYNPAAAGITWPYTGFRATGSKTLPQSVTGQPEDVIQITGVFGWPAVPDDVKQAALIAAADLFKMKDAPFGIAGINELGAMQVRGNAKIMALLDGYVRLKAIAA